MSIRWWMFLGFVYILTHMINGIIEGVYVSGEDQSIFNEMVDFEILETQGVLGIPAFGIGFLSNMGTLMTFNYGFLATAGLWPLRLLLMCIPLGIMWGLFATFWGGAGSFLGGLFRLGR